MAVRTVVTGRAGVIVCLVGLVGMLSSCTKESCLSGEPSCTVSPPCPQVKFECDADDGALLGVETIVRSDQRPGGWNGLASKGDVKMSNRFAEVVIAQIGSQNFLDPNGGSILDLTPRGQPRDSVNSIMQVVGILPGDATYFTELRIIDQRPQFVAVEVHGRLDGRKGVLAYTRYELRPCDRGVRVRTELINTSTDTEMWSLGDGFYWSGREAIPFAAGAGNGNGFAYPTLDLFTINNAFRTFPYLAASGHSADEQVSSFASVSCSRAHLEGFNSEQVSVIGLPRTRVAPRGFQVLERFIAVADGKGVSGAVDVALEVRKQVAQEDYLTVTGKVESPVAIKTNSERVASILISAGTLASENRSPLTQVVPGADGTFSARVPASKSYVVEVHSFGRKVIEREVSASDGMNLGSFVLPATGQVSFRVTDGRTMEGLDSEIFIVPVSAEERAQVQGSFHGRFTSCAPWLGEPPGASPACNRVLIRKGQATADVPVGRYFMYAFHGVFWSLGRETVTVVPGAQTVSMVLRSLDGLRPAGTLTGDFHIHGAASFDSSLPDSDRVLAFSASGLDVAIATDHDVVYDYSRTLGELGLNTTISTIVGLETTGHIPFLNVPDSALPHVVGHYNMWPLKYDPSLPRNGGPYDELVEPGLLFERTKPLFTGLPIIELNHPWAEPEGGRDQGFPRAIGLDLRVDLPKTDDGTRQGMYSRTPAGATTPNDSHNAQEVMNGTDTGYFLLYRAFWWYALNQGHRKVGTANSDSHSLTDNTVGMPFNLVTTSTQPGPSFDVNTFNRSVLDGRVMGTNGPLIHAAIDDGTSEHRYGTAVLSPKANAKLKLKVTSAPWVPVREIRLIVNGQVVKTISNLPLPSDPFASSGNFVRYEGEVPVSELLAGVTGDAWLVVEAGDPLVLIGDLGGGAGGQPDGMPDTTDNNGDGKIDQADVGPDREIGPVKDVPARKEGEPGFEYYSVTAGYPVAFTNPFFLDRDGDGNFSAPGVKGGR